MLLLVPLLLLGLGFSFCHVAFSPLENLTLFVLLALYNFLFYLSESKEHL